MLIKMLHKTDNKSSKNNFNNDHKLISQFPIFNKRLKS